MEIVRPCITRMSVYVPGKPIKEVERELGVSDVVKLASNENPLGPSPKALAAMTEACREVGLYPDGNSFYLKSALAQKLEVNHDQIIMGNGSNEIIQFIASTYINPGDEVIMATPSFPVYLSSTIMMDGVAKEILLKDFRHDLPAMAEAISDKTKLIYLCNPNNPTGTPVSKAEVDAFMAKVPNHILVIFDEAYFEYVDDPNYPNGLDYLRSGRKVMVLRTFSKAYGLAGLRIGYGIGTVEDISYLNRVRPPFNANLVAQAAAEAAWTDTEYLDKVISLNKAEKEFLYSEFTVRNMQYVPTQANFIFVNIGIDSKAAFPALLKKGVIVRSGDIFGFREWIRVTTGTREQNLKFLKALDEVKDQFLR